MQKIGSTEICPAVPKKLHELSCRPPGKMRFFKNMKISRILHAGYVFEDKGTRIAFDPIFENPFSQNCHAFPAVSFDYAGIKKLQLSAIFISHYHDDHCSLESLALLDRTTPIYIYCIHDEIVGLIRALGFLHVETLNVGIAVTIGSISVIPCLALDPDVDSVFHIRAGGLNILNVVDAWIDPSALQQLAKSAPFDVVLWPFQTMREIEVLSPKRATAAEMQLPPEWLEQLKALKPKCIVPSSCQFLQENWSWYNHALFPLRYCDFQEQIEAALPQTRVLRLNPSTAIVLEAGSLQPTAGLTWVVPQGEQNLDYEYRAAAIPPATHEIARRFAELSDEQTRRVFDYCRRDLPARYRALKARTDSFFTKPRLWRLAVYNSHGVGTFFHYHIRNGTIETAENTCGAFSWLTEIPLAKFFAALESGEALTSLYLRVNDTDFSPDVENEIADADVVEDPLIRSLFEGVVGAYQKAQWIRLGQKNKS